jgi:hypothetical protein
MLNLPLERAKIRRDLAMLRLQEALETLARLQREAQEGNVPEHEFTKAKYRSMRLELRLKLVELDVLEQSGGVR